MLARKRAWRRKNREKVAAIVKKSNKKIGREYFRVAAQRRKAAVLALPGTGVTVADWREIKEIFGGRCAYCLGEATSMDHVVPVASGGAHDPSNIVPACKSCNSSKGKKSLLQFVMAGGGVV